MRQLLMARWTWKGFAILLLVFSAICYEAHPSWADPRGVDAKNVAEEDFDLLFIGNDLDGWTKEGPAGFVAKDGMLICNGSGNWPTWLRTEEVFENFVLRLEYRNLYGAESGVLLPSLGRRRQGID